MYGIHSESCLDGYCENTEQLFGSVDACRWTAESECREEIRMGLRLMSFAPCDRNRFDVDGVAYKNWNLISKMSWLACVNGISNDLMMDIFIKISLIRAIMSLEKWECKSSVNHTVNTVIRYGDVGWENTITGNSMKQKDNIFLNGNGKKVHILKFSKCNIRKTFFINVMQKVGTDWRPFENKKTLWLRLDVCSKVAEKKKF